jgi:hypothetical protein
MYKIVLSILVGVVVTLPFIAGTSWWFVEEHMPVDVRIANAYKRGWQDALNTREPVHQDLENACAALWLTENDREWARRRLP